RQRGVERERADVADPMDKVRCGEGAEEEADEVRRHDQPECLGTESLEFSADRQQAAQQAAAGQQQGHAREQRYQWSNGSDHYPGASRLACHSNILIRLDKNPGSASFWGRDGGPGLHWAAWT